MVDRIASTSGGNREAGFGVGGLARRVCLRAGVAGGAAALPTQPSDNCSNFEPITPPSADASLNYRVNTAHFHDDTYTALASSATMQPDAARRKQPYSQINDLLLDLFTFTDAWLD